MNLKLSDEILARVPALRRADTLDNLRWIMRNIKLLDSEHIEVRDLLKLKYREHFKNEKQA